jgi:hypothetical protein
VSVVGTALYQHLPASTEHGMEDLPGHGRKLLMFSDSRQDAAFFAPYMERTYTQVIARRLLWGHLATRAEPEDRFDDYVQPIVNAGARAQVFDEDHRSKAKTTVRTWLMREILGTDVRQSLEGVGLAEVTIGIPRKVRAPRFLVDLGFSETEAHDLARVLLGTLRTSAAVDLPDGVDIDDPIFSPRNAVTTVRRTGSAKGILAWLPGRGTNKRLDYLTRLCQARNLAVSPADLLARIWGRLADDP